METKIIKKVNSETFGKISKNGNGGFIASLQQGQGWNNVFFEARSFKTISGAERWIQKKFA